MKSFSLFLKENSDSKRDIQADMERLHPGGEPEIRKILTEVLINDGYDPEKVTDILSKMPSYLVLTFYVGYLQSGGKEVSEIVDMSGRKQHAHIIRKEFEKNDLPIPQFIEGRPRARNWIEGMTEDMERKLGFSTDPRQLNINYAITKYPLPIQDKLIKLGPCEKISFIAMSKGISMERFWNIVTPDANIESERSAKTNTWECYKTRYRNIFKKHPLPGFLWRSTDLYFLQNPPPGNELGYDPEQELKYLNSTIEKVLMRKSDKTRKAFLDMRLKEKRIFVDLVSGKSHDTISNTYADTKIATVERMVKDFDQILRQG